MIKKTKIQATLTNPINQENQANQGSDIHFVICPHIIRVGINRYFKWPESSPVTAQEKKTH